MNVWDRPHLWESTHKLANGNHRSGIGKLERKVNLQSKLTRGRKREKNIRKQVVKGRDEIYNIK